MVMAITFDAYHGTSYEARLQILSEHCFRESSEPNEWAGTGIYFFIEENEKENAQKWAMYIKMFSRPAIVKAKIEIDPSLIFDLTLEEHRVQFHRFRELYYKKAVESAESLGRTIDRDTRNKLKLDCRTFNTICSDVGYRAVKRQCYIRFRKNGIWADYPKSDIPNCTIFCLRDNGCIKSVC